MGSENSAPRKGPWQTVSASPDLTILRNTETQAEYQEYRRLLSVADDYARERKNYELRANQTADNIVKVESWRGEERKELCTTFYCLFVYVERFQATIDRVSDLTFKDALYLLIEILSATKYLLIEYPDFVIDESKIFVTRDGRVKVWINENPAENVPSPSKSLDSGEVRSEADIVQIIFDIIQSRCHQDQIPYADFMNPVRFSKMGLDEAISHIKLYCFNRKMKIADRLEHLIESGPMESLRIHEPKPHSLTNTRVSMQKERSAAQLKGPNGYSVLNYVVSEYGREEHPQAPQDSSQPNCQPLQCELLRR